MQKFSPILFSAPMVQALLQGRKTMTRRIIKFPKDFNNIEVFSNGINGLKYTSSDFEGCLKRLYPRYNIGTILWVRETFKPTNKDPKKYIYRSTCNSNSNFYKETKWKPSIFMPKTACRLFLKITNIRVERALDISKEDAIAEGIEFKRIDACIEYKNYLAESKEFTTYNDYSFPDSPQLSFFSLWEMINGKESLENNPYVFVYEFERIEKPTNFI